MCQQVIEIGHRADSRHRAVTKQIEEIAACVKGLRVAPATESSSSGGLVDSDGGADSDSELDASGWQQCTEQHNGGRTGQVRPLCEHVSLSGRRRSMLASSLSSRRTSRCPRRRSRRAAPRPDAHSLSSSAGQHPDEAFLGLHCGAGQRRPLEVELVSGGGTRLCAGRDRAGGAGGGRETPRASGTSALEGMDVYFKKADGVAAWQAPLRQGGRRSQRSTRDCLDSGGAHSVGPRQGHAHRGPRMLAPRGRGRALVEPVKDRPLRPSPSRDPGGIVERQDVEGGGRPRSPVHVMCQLNRLSQQAGLVCSQVMTLNSAGPLMRTSCAGWMRRATFGFGTTLPPPQPAGCRPR